MKIDSSTIEDSPDLLILCREQADRIEQLESANKLLADLMAHNARQDAAAAEIQAGRIKELESTLIEERAKLLYFAHVGDGEYCPEVIEEADSLKDRHLENAREDLQSEGKI